MTWEPVIGLEIHVHLKTRSKMFCRCPVGFGAEPNTQTCPVCLAFPGALPVANAKAIEWTILLGLALGCEIVEHAVFSRKNYFYFDNPKGYQISQYDLPFCINGKVLVPGEDGDREVGIVRAHLEEDAAKTVHVGGRTGRIRGADYSLVDFNRAGTPLVEIVTAPDLRSADDAKRFLQLLRQTIVELGISDAEMEKGTLRVDANVSVRPAGTDDLRTRTELKNMNSFNFVSRGIEAEVARQIGVWESGGEVRQETYDFDAATGALTAHRAKEEADDYRYFPEPDLVPVEPPAELRERLRSELPELPAARIRRNLRVHGFSVRDAEAVGMNPKYSRMLERMVDLGMAPKPTAAAILNLFANAEFDLDDVNVGEMGRVLERRDRLPSDVVTEAVAASATPGFSADPYIAQEAVSDEAELEPVIERILVANPGQVEAYRGGKDGLLGFFVGQVMKETGGKANPRVVSELVKSKLDG